MNRTAQAATAWTAAALIFVWAHNVDTQYSMFWVFGLGFGFVLQRARFCFASAFRDLFLLGYGRNMKGVLVGLAVASVGFGLVMSRQVPMTFLGILPPSANVLPLGIHTALGGLLFGIGMVVAGGCVSGSLYRMAEGYVASWVAFAGVMIGLLVSSYTWNWWWDHGISTGPKWWLPAWLGHSGALAVTLLALLAAWVWVLWLEHRAGMVVPRIPHAREPADSVAGEIRQVSRAVFVDGWAVIPAGAVLGGLNVLLFTADHPWGFTGELSRWSMGAANLVRLGPPPLLGVADLPGCAMVPADGTVLNHMVFLVVGMWFGSFGGALGAGEFKIRIPKKPARYAQSLGGGVLMGYGAGLAMGCTIGAFFSGIPSLAVNGWVFALFLGAGAWVGTRPIQRIQ